jgi:predicted DNA-binding ribbon-helix-helix protein
MAYVVYKVRLSKDVKSQLRRIARKRKVSIGALLTEAAEEWLAENTPWSRYAKRRTAKTRSFD